MPATVSDFHVYLTVVQVIERKRGGFVSLAYKNARKNNNNKNISSKSERVNQTGDCSYMERSVYST